MKKNLLLILLMSFSLTSCVVIENPSSNQESSELKDSSSNESPSVEKESSSNESSSNNESTSIEKDSSSNESTTPNKDSSSDDNSNIDPNATKIELGYGDYVTSINNQYVGENLYNKYIDLTK